jgi:hypothetical protein
VTRLLLDFPWDLSDVFAPGHNALGCLLEFDNLVRSTGLVPVPFIENEEYAAFWKPKGGLGHRSARNTQRAVGQFLAHCHRQSDSICLATPNPEPTRLRVSWRRALREEIENEKNHNSWRSPQIIVPRVRHLEWWPAIDEINIRCEACAGEPAWDAESRVLAILEQYESHQFATSDVDPWNLHRIHPPNQPGQAPCYLPKLPGLHRVSIESLAGKLIEARNSGCRVEGRHYFIPPDDWRPENVDKTEWRQGRAFARELSHERNQMGYRDYENGLWVWDLNERHWDVQKGGRNYIRVSHTGELL